MVTKKLKSFKFSPYKLKITKKTFRTSASSERRNNTRKIGFVINLRWKFDPFQLVWHQRAVIAVAPTGKASFVYEANVQYNGKWPFSLVYVLKPLKTAIRVIVLFHFLTDLAPQFLSKLNVSFECVTLFLGLTDDTSWNAEVILWKWVNTKSMLHPRILEKG